MSSTSTMTTTTNKDVPQPVEFRVIGAGLPRTGTSSLKLALQKLGFGPTHHMFDTWESTELSQAWLEALRRIAEGEPNVALHHLVKGFGSGVDSPISDVYVELAEQFPEAKVILTCRPSSDWLKSYLALSSHLGNIFALSTWVLPECYHQRRMAMEGILPLWNLKYGSFGEHMMDERIEEAKKSIPADRLLLFQVTEGWEPLCKFLDVPIPDEPFPRVNDGAQVATFLHEKAVRGRLVWKRLLTPYLAVLIVLLAIWFAL